MAPTEGRSSMPGIWVVIAGLAIGSTPFVLPALSATDGALRWVVWGIAMVTIAYTAVSFWRVYRERGVWRALRWLLTGSGE